MRIVSLAVVLCLVTPPALGDSARPGPVVRVLDAGSGKKRELRYAWDAGSVSQVALTIDTSAQVKLGGKRVSSPRLPPIQYVLETKVGKGDDARARLVVTVKSATRSRPTASCRRCSGRCRQGSRGSAAVGCT